MANDETGYVKIESCSIIEEMLSVLYLIASGVFLLVGWKALAIILLVKAVIDMAISVYKAFGEINNKPKTP